MAKIEKDGKIVYQTKDKKQPDVQGLWSVSHKGNGYSYEPVAVVRSSTDGKLYGHMADVEVISIEGLHAQLGEAQWKFIA